jgi:DNA-binding response OmpR family regulator
MNRKLVGLEALRRLRQEGKPIPSVAAARSEVEDKVTGMDMVPNV